MPVTWPIDVITRSGKGSPLNAAEFDSNLTTLRDGANELNDRVSVIENEFNAGINADKVDGYDASQTPAPNTIPVANANGNLNSWIAQGSDSGLNADLLDGLDSSAFAKINVQWIAHGGFSSVAPENTLVAFEMAIAYGFDAIECDIRFTSDGVPVIIHDSTVDRTTNGTGNVGDKTLDEIKSLDAGSWFSSKFAGVTIPTFEEFLEVAKKNNIHIYPEIKEYNSQSDINMLVDMVVENGLEYHCTFISFNFTALDYVRQANKNIRIGYLVSDENGFNNALNLAQINGNAIIDTHYQVVLNNPSLISTARSQNVDVAVWTVNTSADVQKLRKLGITKITTDKLQEVLI